MKNKSFILSIVLWLVSTALMAVSLPSSSYTRSFSGSADTYHASMGTGVTFSGFSTVGSGDYTKTGMCTTEGVQGDPEECKVCCNRDLFVPCMEDIGDIVQCGALNTECVESCTKGTSLPLDAPTAFLLALVAAYGAVAVYRRKMQQA